VTDLFCAFHPKRVIVPSFELRLTLPLKWASAGDARLPLAGRLGVHIGQNRRVRDGFNEPAAKSGRWDAEDDVAVPALAGQRVAGRQEVRLRDVATLSVASARDDEEIMHLTIAAAVGILFEPRLPDGAILRDEYSTVVFRRSGSA